jgi:hypothetical protein
VTEIDVEVKETGETDEPAEKPVPEKESAKDQYRQSVDE